MGGVLKLLRSFETSHDLKLSKPLSEPFVEKLFLLEENYEIVINKFIDLIKHNLGIFKRSRNEKNKWIRTYFYEWVWFYICEKITEKEGFNSYSVFKKCEIFDYENMGVSSQYGNMLSTDVNIALGRLYSKTKNKYT